MQDHLIRSTLRVLATAGSGHEGTQLESAAGLAATVEMLAAQARASAGLDGQESEVEKRRNALASAYLDEGHRALKEVAAKGEQASLSAAQSVGLEAIVRLTGRPSYLVKDDRVQGVPADSKWAAPIAVATDGIRDSVQSIGRVDLPDEEGGYLGTAFVVSADLVMTNRHVAIAFARGSQGGWDIAPGYHPSVDFKCEHGSNERRSFAVTGIEVIHPEPLVDMALLRVARTDRAGASLPAPLRLASDPSRISPNVNVYVVGYPAFDPRNDASAMAQVFGAIFQVKRFAPGEILAPDNPRKQFTHDCSTLGGNSGSCVIDLGSHSVFGLHFGGSYLVANRSVSLPLMRGDPLLAGKGLNY